jgi:hypothetical protein
MRHTLAGTLWLGNGSLQCDGKAVHLAGNQLFCSPQSWSAGQLDGHGHMLVLVRALEGFGVCGTRVNYDQLSASHFSLLETKVFVSVNTR